MGHGHTPVETLSDHGINASTNVSKLCEAWLIKKMLMENKENSIFFPFYLIMEELFG